MSGAAHLTALTERHRLLEKKIEEEMARPAADSVRLSQLKLDKLRVKDRIDSSR
jgi:hypothetical protein